MSARADVLPLDMRARLISIIELICYRRGLGTESRS
jgi:hypothetical protein